MLLADVNSAHTRKWVSGLSSSIESIILFSLPSPLKDTFADYPNVKVFSFGSSQETVSKKNGSLGKLGYIRALGQIKKIIKTEKPDILHAHYATSYGLLGRLTRFRPFIVSVWGSDVYSFPRRSIIHRWLFNYNLKSADRILSTSHAMASEINKYFSANVIITPFGIDLEYFKKKKVSSVFSEKDVVLGTVKSLEQVYRIDKLIRVFAELKTMAPELSLKLLIVGDGSLKGKLEAQVKDLKIEEFVHFASKVEHTELVNYYNMLDVFVALSDSESFGVSIIEASACELPVVVSDVGGLPEVVDNGLTGYVLPRNDLGAISAKLHQLIKEPELRQKFGENGRKKVAREYDFSVNLKQMLALYKEFSDSKS